MLPYWVQWLFASGAIAFLVAIFATIWIKLARIEKRIGRLEDAKQPPNANEQPEADK